MSPKAFFYTAIMFIALSICARKKELDTTATVVIDCSGTYLRVDGKDLRVCNLEKVAVFQDVAKVSANFKKIKDCTGSGSLSTGCYLYHAYESLDRSGESKVVSYSS